MSDLDAIIRSIVRDELARALRGQRAANDDYLSTGAAARIAAVTPGTIRRWIREGRLPECRAGRVVRILRGDLERLLADAPDRSATMTPEALARKDFG